MNGEQRRQAAAATAVIRTVQGDIDPALLGRTDAHEHLLMRSPLLRGDELDDLERSAAETAALRSAGIDALVELTPIGLGRNPLGLAAIASRTGMHIIAATGLHREAHYPPEHWIHRTSPAVFADLFVRDLLEGCDGADYSGPLPDPTDVRAGVIKVGTGYWSISVVERKVLEGAAAAQRRTGVSLVCHLERGTAAWEVWEVLDRDGVPAERVAFAHADRNPDPGLHGALTQAGLYLGYDGMARAKYWPDSVLIDCLLAVVEAGGADRLLLGGDVARRSSFRSYGGIPGMSYLPERFIPRLRAAGGNDLVERLLIANPARFLGFTTRPEAASPGTEVPQDTDRMPIAKARRRRHAGQ